jgi:arylsulfatase A-like enzyme
VQADRARDAAIATALALFGLAGSGCRPEASVFGDLPRERVAAAAPSGNEWRDAVAISPGSSARFDLGPATPGSAVRIGLLDSAGHPVSVRILAGDQELGSLRSPGTGGWTDRRLEGLVAKPANVQVECTSERSFWVSTAEVVTPPSTSPPVIVVLVDTLRRDHLGCYGYGRPTSPNIDAFARESIRFENLVPASSWTRPSVASLLTSTVPSVHGGEDMGDHLRPGLPWIGESFQKSGYETRALITNPNCLPIWGFGGGFSRYVDVGSEDWIEEDDSVVMQRAAAAVRDAAGRPFFLYVHALAPHEPYTPPEPQRSQFTSHLPAPPGAATNPHLGNVDLYDAEIRYFDTLFGKFLDTLREIGLYDSSVIVLLSDHGQAFGEHGDFGHGSSLFGEQMNPPLIVRLPGGAHGGHVVGALVEMIDIGPTLAALAGVPEDARLQGTSFVPLIEKQSWGKTLAYASLQHQDSSQYMTRTLGSKYLRDLAANRDRWFDLATDPLERQPLDAPAADGASLRAHLVQMTSAGQAGLHVLITHDSRSALAVAGEIRAVGLGDVRLEYPKQHSALHPGQDAVRFTADMPGGNRSARLAEAMDASATLRNMMALTGVQVPMEQDNVHVIAQVPMDAKVAIQLAFDGVPVAAEQVHFGAARSAHPLDGRTVQMAEVLESAVTFNPAALPVKTAAYVWYVPSTQQISGSELSPELRQSLRALGYVVD